MAKLKFSKRVVTEVAKRLDDLASEVELAQASLEVPKDGGDAELILQILDSIRMGARRALDEWEMEQHEVFPETKP